jgi:hypothetical protein
MSDCPNVKKLCGLVFVSLYVEILINIKGPMSMFSNRLYKL